MINLSIVEDLTDISDSIYDYIQPISDINCNHIFSNAEDALGGLLKYRPQVVLMDIGLPNMSGIECMIRVKSQCPEMKFIMFTVFEDDEKIFESLKAGADGYILKREPMEQIITSIRQSINRGAPMSKSIALKVLKSFRNQKQQKNNVEVLSSRQKEILEKLSKGFPYKLIADQLSISIGTVKQHIHQIYKRLHVNNKTEAINKYLNREP